MKTTRRQFLKSIAPVAGVLAAPNLLRAANLNGRVQHACIGVGGMMGFNDFQNFKQHSRTDIVAICDVDAGNLERALKEVPNARPYRDWREMLAKEGGKIDSINATVPDHMHAAICYSAMQAGKHVYCQKPMCHDVAEVRALTQTAAAKNLKTQLGNQHSSGMGDRMALTGNPGWPTG
jgi:predicted dehydrogenase